MFFILNYFQLDTQDSTGVFRFNGSTRFWMGKTMDEWESPLEERLARHSLQTPRPEFDARMESLFNRRRFRFAGWSRPVKLWQCLAACAACLLLGLAIQTLRTPAAPSMQPPIQRTVVYVMPQEEQQLFDATTRACRPWRGDATVTVEAVSGKNNRI